MRVRESWRMADTWFIVVDGGRGRLLRGRMISHGRIHVDEHDSISNHHDEHEHGRPSPRSGRGGSSYASSGHEGEQQLHRFAKEVTGWIEAKVARHGIERLALFSAPRLLGELRKLYPPGLGERIDEHPADLTQVSTAALARHPAVAELIG